MKFSDALRGAADRAPVDEVQVSTNAITGRIKRERALRVGANGLVGAGAAAVVVFAAIGPAGGAGEDMSMAAAESLDAAPEIAPQDSDSMMGAADGAAEGFSHTESLWMCGTDFDPADGLWTWGDTSGVTYTVDEPQTDEWEVTLPSTIEAHRTVEMVSFADYVITWDSMVVGHLVHSETLQYGPDTGTFLPDGQVRERMEPGTDFDSLEQWTVLNPVNCWDGQPLPAGDYEVHQAWTLAYVDESANESEETLLEPFRVAADPVTLTVDGDPVEDPFGAYLDGDFAVEPQPLPEPIDPLPIVPLPDGYLTPDMARELFAASAVDAAWDMAPGSQRWVMTQDSKGADGDVQWESNYFGCMWGDEGSSTFPARSAELDLLDVNVKLPARIGVSYGFVVDGNPLVKSTVTNSSEYTIPGFWGGAQPQLFLVQGGKVVATASPQGVDSGLGLAATTMVIDGNGALEPGATLSGDFLWRDVHGCDSQGAQSAVAPGSYTVLAVHSLSVSNHQMGVAQALPELAIPFDGLELGGDSPSAINSQTDILPAPDEWDSVELQGWTSLGTVTVS